LRLEPIERKLSRSVLRGGGGGDTCPLTRLVSDKLQLWCEERNIQLQFIQPGKPVQNAFIERNNGSLRRELLDAYHFFTLQEVRQMAEEWQQDYNVSIRPTTSSPLALSEIVLGHKTL